MHGKALGRTKIMFQLLKSLPSHVRLHVLSALIDLSFSSIRVFSHSRSWGWYHQVWPLLLIMASLTTYFKTMTKPGQNWYKSHCRPKFQDQKDRFFCKSSRYWKECWWDIKKKAVKKGSTRALVLSEHFAWYIFREHLFGGSHMACNSQLQNSHSRALVVYGEWCFATPGSNQREKKDGDEKMYHGTHNGKHLNFRCATRVVSTTHEPKDT